MSDIENNRPKTDHSSSDNLTRVGDYDPIGARSDRPPLDQRESKKSGYGLFPYRPRYPKLRVGSETIRGHCVAAFGEFCGTFMFLWCAYVIANIANHDVSLEATPDGSHPGQLIMIALGFGFSVMFSVWCFSGVSGGALNPAVSLSLALSRAIKPTRCLVHWIAQMLDGMAAGGAAHAMTPGGVRFANSLGLGCSRSRGLFIEMFGTTILCFTVLMTAIESKDGSFMAALPIGISLFISHLACTAYTGTGVNPARSFGAALAAKSFPTYFWIYWIGPLLGAILASAIWQALQWLNYADVVALEKKAKEEVLA